jgi:outer membrane immunogenic protein
MYRLLIAAAAVLSVVQTASGADLPLKAAPAPVVVAPNWTGFYIGINAGYAWGHGTADNTFGPTILSGRSDAA